ncbi:MAG: phage holin family protein [Alloprevotella sp.]|nr:phage holin family protein [Alloprevotella sp.]MBR1652284.1 phage holin family protein [Alloprevotella sp.]
MFSSDKNVEAIRQLCEDAKDYLELKGRDVQLSVAEKLSVGISALVLGAVLLLLLAFVLLFLAAMCAAFLANYVGITGACAISAGLLVLLAIVLYLKRRSWIVNPVTRFVATLILDTQKD